MTEETFDDIERRYLLDLAVRSLSLDGSRDGDDLAMRVIRKLSGTDTRLVAVRAYPSVSFLAHC